MSVSGDARCPKCGGANIARSHWRSHDEKHGNVGSLPVRCHDCRQRFFVPAVREKTKIPVAVMLGGGAFVLVLAIVTIGVFWQSSNATKPVAATPAPVEPTAIKTAESGNPDEQFRVASLLLAEAEANMTYSTKAIELLKQAAEQGHAQAMLRLGTLYRSGIGAPQNFGLAAKWIEKSAHKGEPQAMLELGRLYRDGIVMPRDRAKAYIWLNRAAAARNTDAPLERADVARELSADELQRAQDESTGGGPPTPEPITTKHP